MAHFRDVTAYRGRGAVWTIPTLLALAGVLLALVWGLSAVLQRGPAASAAPMAAAAQGEAVPLLSKVVDIYLDPSATTLGFSQMVTVTIKVDANGQQVGGVDSFIDFDNTRLQVQSLTNGGTLPVVLASQFDNGVGVITYSACTFAGYPTSQFTLATVVLQSQGVTGTANIDVVSQTGRVTRADLLGADLTRYITGTAITVIGPPTADFVASPQTTTVGTTVAFTDTSTGSVSSWLWDLGDGMTSTLQNPTHPYASAGPYTVTLTATGPGGWDAETKTSYIHVYNPVTAGFTASTPRTGNVPLTVYFTDTSTGDLASWLWNFGDGNTSTSQNPSNAYNTAGSFTVTLTANGQGGDSDTIAKTNYITVTGVNVAFQVAFQGGTGSGTARWANVVTTSLSGGTASDGTYVVTTTNTGAYTLSGIVPATYTVTAVSPHTLLNQKTGVVVAPPSTSVNMCTLLEGDANMSGQVNIADFGLLAASYLKMCGPPPQPGYNPMADFDNSCQVNIADFGLLAANYLVMSPVNCP